MDQQFLERFRERSAYETGRVEPPDGFPKLPDLPLGRYTDPAFQELEAEHLFKRVWLYAGHESELPAPGSYKLCDIVGAPILLARDDDGEVRAFYNACRHRGAPVVRGTSGEARMLVCQFHSWSYNLRGELVRVPDERDFVGLQKEERCLPGVRCERWGGWYFVNLDPDAIPLLEYLDPLPRLLPEVAAARFRVIDTKSVELACNWKLLAEAFLEVYHARTIHPKTVGPSLDTRGTVITLYDHGHQSMLSPVNAGHAVRQPGAAAGLRGRHRDLPRRGPAGARVLPQPDRAARRPRLSLPRVLAAGHRPHPPRHRLVRGGLGRRAAAGGAARRSGSTGWTRFDTVMDEDYENLAPIQRSMEFAAHGGQAINYQERRIWHVQAWIDKVIGPERIPEHLRVPDLLDAWVEHP